MTGERLDYNSAKQAVQNKAEDIVVPYLADRLATILANETPEYVPGAKEKYTKLRSQPGENGLPNIPIAVSAHETQGDVVGVAESLHPLLASEYEAYMSGVWGEGEVLEGFVIPIANSVGSGHQGKVLQKGLPNLERRCNELGLELIGTTRPEDVERYGAEPNGTSVTDTLKEAVASNYGLALFPEASVQGGRLVVPEYEQYEGDFLKYAADQVVYQVGKTGLIDAPVYGMQQFNAAMLNSMLRIISEKGNPFVIPIAIDGINRLVRPTNERTNMPTAKGIVAAGVGLDMKAVRMRVGMPQTITELRGELTDADITPTRQNMADHIGRKVARLLPEDRQGFYRQQSLA